MIDAGYSASEIRQSMQNRLIRQGASSRVIVDQAESSSDSSVQSQSELNVRGNLGNQPHDLDMSEMSSMSNDDSWGGVSDAESLHSGHFRQRGPIASLEKQS